MKRLLPVAMLSLALVAVPARTHAAPTSFTFTNGSSFCGFHPSCTVAPTSLGGSYYLYAFPPTSMTGGTVPNVYLSFSNIVTPNGIVSSLSKLFTTSTWTQITGTPVLSPTNQYELNGAFSGTDNFGFAYTGTNDLIYGIYYSRGGGGRGGGGAGWRFEMLSGTTTITYQ